MLLSNLLTMLLLDHVDNVVALGLLSRGADLLGDGPGHGMALLHRTTGASLLGPGLGLGDGPGVADGLGDSGALLGGDGVVGGLACGGGGDRLAHHGTGTTDQAGTTDTVIGISLGLSQGQGGEGKEEDELLHGGSGGLEDWRTSHR